MFKIIFGFIFKIRDWLQNKFGILFERFRDPETGKLTFTSPKSLPRIVSIVALVLFFLVLFSQFITSENTVTGGKEAFEKEIRPSAGINSRDVISNSLEDDPFKNLGAISRDQFGEGEKIGGKDFSGISTEGTLSVSECAPIVDKMKSNLKLTPEEELLAEQCLKENPMGLTAEELAFAQSMLDPNVSAAEKELLSKALSGKASVEELEVARALISQNPEKAAQAKEAIAMGQDAVNALGKRLDGQQLTEEEKALLAKVDANAKTAAEKVGEAVKGAVVEGFSELQAAPQEIADSAKPLTLPAQQDEAIKALSEDISKRESLINKLEDEMARDQIQVSDIGSKIAAGKQLNPSEAKKIEDFSKKRQQTDLLKRLQETRKEEFGKKAQALQNSIASAISSVQRAIPTGTFIEYEGDPLDCRKIKVAKKVKKKVVAKATSLDTDGRPLRPEEVEFIKLHRKNQYEVAKLEKEIVKGTDMGIPGQPINASALAGEGGQVGIQDLQQLFVFKDSSLKSFELTPDMKIPAVLDSEILISDKGKGQVVRFRIIADVYNPVTNQIVIPKNSIATATTGGFDNDTAIMDITIQKAVIGSGKTVTVNLSVGSADGTMGLKGKVYDTTGKYLAGAFITAFSAGALGWFSQQVVAPFQESTAAGEALTGAGLAGAAEVMTKISEVYAGKLNSAANIFYVKRGVPVVLFPQ